MIELNPYRKNRINLQDYDHQTDIKNRVIISHFSSDDLEVVEEILFNSLKFPIQEIARNLEMRTDKLLAILKKLQETSLLQIVGDFVVVDKEMRKYFDVQMSKFEENYIPGMEFLQGLLRTIPIHVLPNWYHIPRTSDNIFESLIEKYLDTPQTFQRYLMELNFSDEALPTIINRVYNSSDLKVSAKKIRQELNLSDERLQECALQLELNFVLCLTYEKIHDRWESFFTPFREWRDYIMFTKATKPCSICDEVIVFRDGEYPFSADMASLLTFSNTKPLPTVKFENHYNIDPDAYPLIAGTFKNFDLSNSNSRKILENYLPNLIDKLIDLRFASIKEGLLTCSAEGLEWMNLPSEKRALSMYRHPLHEMTHPEFASMITEKNIREIEKSIQRIAHLDWVYLDEFIKGIVVPLNENCQLKLKKLGRNWKYTLPSYSEGELRFIQTAIMDWLFESGLIKTGRHRDKACFCITKLGKTLFGQ